jgi:hypothetical protein
MLEIPYNLISCSWPRPIEHADARWTSEPDWGAPAMPIRPPLTWQSIHGEPCWTIDWRQLCRGGLAPWDPHFGGEMRGFHIVFRLEVNRTGRLVFWDDDGCIIRRNGEIVHHDPYAHWLTRHEIEVSAGDHLEVAHWQLNGEWLWGARIASFEDARAEAPGILWRYREAAEQCLHQPNGPPLKMYSHASAPVRTIVSIYSMVLNGYVPSQVLLFGEHQWSEETRQLFSSLLPFAEIVPTEQVVRYISAYGGPKLAEMAYAYWWVMKALVSLLYPPDEFCSMDDDVFILDHTGDALADFQSHDLIFAPDMDHTDEYLATWEPVLECSAPLPTAGFNAGLYWIRNGHDPNMVADFALQVRPEAKSEYAWEQGFIATLYAARSTRQLSTQRYFYPLFDGLPGGPLGYDYANNPCGFASVHFGGLREKPSDIAALLLAPEILGRS